MKLRAYQLEGRESVITEWATHQRTLVVWPTGTGKTLLFASIIQAQQPGRFMVIAHREELIWQARERIEELTGLATEIEMAELHAKEGGLLSPVPVVISTIQSLNSTGHLGKRLYKFKPEDFSGLIVDEAHHAAADSYRSIIDYFCRNPRLRVLGVTATPDRSDREGLGQIFQSVSHVYEIQQAIQDGWLVDIDQQFVRIESLDFSGIRTTAGDLNSADLANVMENEKVLQGTVSAALRIVGNRRAIVFTSSVNQAERSCEVWNRLKPGTAAWVCGATAKEDRRQILRDFTQGIQVVFNCGVLTEGYDNPLVEVIVMARPTKSRTLYCQMIGRSTRPLPGLVDRYLQPEERREAIAQSTKQRCLVVDFVGNSGRHKLINVADILGGKKRATTVKRAIDRAKESEEAVHVSELLEEEEKPEQAELLEKKAREAAARERLLAKNVKFSQRFVSPFDVLDLPPIKEDSNAGRRPPSPAQLKLLLQQGINPDQMSYRRAQQIVGALFSRWKKKLCSIAQARVIKTHYPQTDVTNLSRTDASQILDALARKYGWSKSKLTKATNYGQARETRIRPLEDGSRRPEIETRTEEGRPLGEEISEPQRMAGAGEPAFETL